MAADNRPSKVSLNRRVTFADDQIYDEWAALVQTNVAPGYTQYCNENNITIEHVIEDI